VIPAVGIADSGRLRRVRSGAHRPYRGGGASIRRPAKLGPTSGVARPVAQRGHRRPWMPVSPPPVAVPGPGGRWPHSLVAGRGGRSRAGPPPALRDPARRPRTKPAFLTAPCPRSGTPECLGRVPPRNWRSSPRHRRGQERQNERARPGTLRVRGWAATSGAAVMRIGC